MSALQDAAARAVRSTPENLNQEREDILRKMTKLQKERHALLGIEAEARSELSRAIEQHWDKIRMLREAEPFAGRYPKLDLDPLSWRNNQGFPRLVLFRTDSPEFRIKVRPSTTYELEWDTDVSEFLFLVSILLGGIGILAGLGISTLLAGCQWLCGNGWELSKGIIIWGGIIGAAPLLIILVIQMFAYLVTRFPYLIQTPTTLPKLPKKLRNCYADVAETLRKKHLQHGQSATLRAEFRGLIPEPVREKIRKAQKEFQEVFLLAEPGEWSLEKVTLLQRDPLVVGWDGTSLWLIDAFNTTPVEEYVRREFTT